jgi:hypothetical protein
MCFAAPVREDLEILGRGSAGVGNPQPFRRGNGQALSDSFPPGGVEDRPEVRQISGQAEEGRSEIGRSGRDGVNASGRSRIWGLLRNAG